MGMVSAVDRISLKHEVMYIRSTLPADERSQVKIGEEKIDRAVGLCPTTQKRSIHLCVFVAPKSFA